MNLYSFMRDWSGFCILRHHFSNRVSVFIAGSFGISIANCVGRCIFVFLFSGLISGRDIFDSTRCICSLSRRDVVSIVLETKKES